MSDISIPYLHVLDCGLLEYGEALKLQEALVSERIAGLSQDRLVLVEHPPVVTLGRSGTAKDLRVCEEALKQKGAAVFRIDRGGMATFHGPGQLVAYPILKLVEQDLHRYLQKLLMTVVEVLRGYGLKAEPGRDRPGVWAGTGKIASVGIAVRRWVTYHGLALNVSTDLDWFNTITPCGNPEERITSMECELGGALNMSEVKARFIEAFCRVFEYPVGPEVRRLNREQRPPWLSLSAPRPESLHQMETLIERLRLGTVCQSAQCPNMGECFEHGTATFMILGTTCTRSCRFCGVTQGIPEKVDEGEPERVAQAVAALGISHAVITSVTRDDLADGGAEQFACTIGMIRECCPGVTVEVLVPDFAGSLRALETVCRARPDVFNHNVETVPRLYPLVRPGARYQRSLQILEYAAGQGFVVKSGLMLGLGEAEQEILETLGDLRRTGCSRLTLGQYLAPTKHHVPIVRYVPPEEFEKWAKSARSSGFERVVAGPLVRSSYHAEEMV